jgi:hypothetical protein
METETKHLFEPFATGLVCNSPREFVIEENNDCLIIKAPRSQVPGTLAGFAVTLIVLAFLIHAFMPQALLFFYALGVPVYFGLTILIYFLVRSHHIGDWLVWRKETDQIFFPRLGKAKSRGELVCLQVVYDDRSSEPHYELNCVFKASPGYERYPLFLYWSDLDGYAADLGRRMDVRFQIVRFDNKKPVISGYDFLASESMDS